MTWPPDSLMQDRSKAYRYFSTKNPPHLPKNWSMRDISDIPKPDGHDLGCPVAICERAGSNDIVEIYMGYKDTEAESEWTIHWKKNGLAQAASYDTKEEASAVAGMMAYMINSVIRSEPDKDLKEKLEQREEKIEQQIDKITKLGSELEMYKEAWDMLPLAVEPDDIRKRGWSDIQ